MLLPLVLIHRGRHAAAAASAALSSLRRLELLRPKRQQPSLSAPLFLFRCLSSSSSVSPPPVAASSVSSFLREDPESRGSALIMDGTAAAAAWEREMAAEVRSIVDGGGDLSPTLTSSFSASSPSSSRTRRRPPSLAVVLVGDRPDSVLYVARKLEAAARVGIDARAIRLPATSTEQEVRHAVAATSADASVDGVLVQLPLPAGISEAAVLASLDPWKDVDGFHHVNLGRLAARGRAAAFVPAAALGVVELLRRCGAPLGSSSSSNSSTWSSSSSNSSSSAPAHALVLGDSTTVGVPLAMLLGREGVAATTLCHRPSTAALFEKEEGEGKEEKAAKEEDNDSRRALAGACLPTLPGGSAGARGHVGAEDEDNDEVAGAESGSESGSESDGGRGEDEDGGASSAAALAAGAAAGASALPPSPSPSSPLSSLAGLVRSADIVVAALGSPEVVPGEWIKPGAWVVDVGINVLPVVAAAAAAADKEKSGESSSTDSSSPDPMGTRGVDYRVVGDVHPSAFLRACAVSPVPGGVGPMTIAALLANTVRASRLNERRRERASKKRKSLLASSSSSSSPGGGGGERAA